jgi:hypothetical protein
MLKTLSFLSVVALMSATEPVAPPVEWTIAAWVGGGLAVLLTVANAGLDLWGKLFHKTPPDEERYATKQQLADLQEKLNEEVERIDETLEGTCQRIETRFEVWLTEMTKSHEREGVSLRDWQIGVERVIGKLEARTESKKG